MEHDNTPVYAGIDTHADTHHLAVIDSHGRPLKDLQIPATATGYRCALTLLGRYRSVAVVGVECTGSYGAAITRDLLGAGYRVAEVNRPNRFDRRARGKTDTFDAYSAAEAVLAGRASAAPKGADGLVEALRVLRTTRSSALRERTRRSIRSRPCSSLAPSGYRPSTEACPTSSLSRSWLPPDHRPPR